MIDKENTTPQPSVQRWPKITAAWVGFLALFSIMVIPDRHAFFIPYAPNIHFASLLFIICTCIVASMGIIWLRADASTHINLKNNLPIVLFTLFNVVFIILAFAHSQLSPTPLNPPQYRWWANALLLQIAVMCAWYLGQKLSTYKIGNRVLGITLVSGLGTMCVILLSEYLHLAGYVNPLGSLLVTLNSQSIYPVWIWEPWEALRAQGFGRYPVVYSFTAIMVFCWALASKNLHNLRMAAITLSAIAIFLTGSRTALVSLIIISIVFIVLIARKKGLFQWIRTNIKQLSFTILVTFLLIGSIQMLAGPAAFDRGIPFITAATQELEAPISQTAQGASGYTDSEPAENQQGQLIHDILYVFSSGRIDVWERTLNVINEHPLGVWMTSNSAIGTNAHNELLQFWLTSGPISAALYVWLLFWLAFKTRAPEAPLLPPLIVVGIASFGIFEVVFAQLVLAPVAFFIIGYLIKPDLILHKKGQSKTRTVPTTN